jgi:peptidoglycan/xylan/chitin deacetylase (PgdA/CDA1 family)
MTGGSSAILTYHSLDDSGSVVSTPPALFRRQMEFLAASRIPVVPLDQVAGHPGAVAITFDDGFRNLLSHAIPVLEQHGFPATIFAVSDYCGRMNDWPSQPQGAVPLLPLLSWDELAALPSLISMGAHTATHPDLSRLSAQECERELHDCQSRMEQRLARPVRWLAYPYGTSSAAVRSVAARYFDLAVGTTLGFLPQRSDRLNLPRLDTYYLRGSFPIERLFSPLGRPYMGFRRMLREFRQKLPV